jgi:two-component system sensor histidine kinase/response regulator
MMESIAAPAKGSAITGRPGPAQERLRVLVAEDDVCNQQVLRLMLERRGCRVQIVSNGRVALAALAEASFDLLLLDMRMPEVDGFHVIESLRRSERDTLSDSRLPVIAVTALAAKADRQRCMEAGVDEYLSKPFRVAALYGALDRALGSAQSGCPTDDVRSTFADPSMF